MLRLLFVLALLPQLAAGTGVVLVTGASGRTGSLVYAGLRKAGLSNVRALVRSVDKARLALNCTKCDESEGIFVGDVTNPSSLKQAFDGVEVVVDAIGVYGNESSAVVKAVEWHGVQHQVEALAANGNKAKHMIMVSSEGTTSPPTSKEGGVLFYKLQAEAFVMSAGLPFTIVQPCGLAETAGGLRKFLVGHDDSAPWSEKFYMIPRADVAAVIVAAVTNLDKADGLRFNLCTEGDGTGPGDALGALRDAHYPWQLPMQTLQV